MSQPKADVPSANRPRSDRCYPCGMTRGRMIGDAERRLAAVIPQAVRDVRRAQRLTQAELARRCQMSQSQISRVESGGLAWLTVQEAGRLLDTLGIQIDIAARQPHVVVRPFQQDAAHARTLGYVVRRLATHGWEVRTEVEFVDGRARGWIDLVAFQARYGALFVGEIKAGLEDMGAAQRQVQWYERLAGQVKRRFDWFPVRSATALLVLATAANDELIMANHALVSRAFPGRAQGLHGWLVTPGDPAPARSIALIDPRSRRNRWLLALVIDGRRSQLRYATYADFMGPVPSKRPGRGFEPR